MTDNRGYRYDPYTGQPISQTGTWIPSGYSNQQRSQQMVQQESNARASQPGVIVRQVASIDEAKAVPTDFSGALTIMPDWAHGYIYAKALADDGNPIFRAYRYEPSAQAVPSGPQVEYAPMTELERLRLEVAGLRDELAAFNAPQKEAAEKPNGKGSKA